ncbi:MAG: hypothetical protein QNJ41_28780 [Xenococcaceae cyanobacterium MO_188.B32]|nr:hypothetical protein [Xenococcaceae cyanobacterium MO_188.B32]
MLRLNKQIGVSPTALRRLETQMRQGILTYQQEQHQQLKLTPAQIQIIAGADETFFPGLSGIVLVLMDARFWVHPFGVQNLRPKISDLV